MAYLFNDAGSNYLTLGNPVVTVYPFTMACWFNSDDTDNYQILMWCGDKDAANNYWNLSLIGSFAGDPVSAVARNTSENYASTTSGYSANRWHHACGVFTGSLDRAAYIDGGSKGVNNLNDTTPDACDTTCIGRNGDSTPGQYMSGYICEAAVWNVALTDAEVAQLAKGYCPLLIKTSALIAYWPLLRGLQNYMSDYLLTNSGATVSPHYNKIIYPSSTRNVFETPSGAAPSVVPQLQFLRQTWAA